MTAPARNDLLDALAKLAGIPLEELGKTACKRLQKCVNIIKESSPDVDLEEMRARYRRFIKFWPGIKCTPEALAKRWVELGAPKPILIIDNPTEEIPPNWVAFMCEKQIQYLEKEGEPNGPAAFAIVTNQFKFCPESWKRECREAWAQRGGNVVPFKENSA